MRKLNYAQPNREQNPQLPALVKALILVLAIATFLLLTVIAFGVFKLASIPNDAG
jgi:hypothetical protein